MPLSTARTCWIRVLYYDSTLNSLYLDWWDSKKKTAKLLVWIPPVILKTLKMSLLLALIWINFNSGKRWNGKDLKWMSLSLTFPFQHRDPGFKPQARFSLCGVSEENRREKSFLFYTFTFFCILSNKTQWLLYRPWPHYLAHLAFISNTSLQIENGS